MPFGIIHAWAALPNAWCVTHRAMFSGPSCVAENLQHGIDGHVLSVAKIDQRGVTPSCIGVGKLKNERRHAITIARGLPCRVHDALFE